MKKEKSNILKSSMPLFSASFAAQGVNFLLLFLIPHFFEFSGISHFFIFSSIGQLLGTILSFQIQNSIVLSSSPDQAASRFRFSILLIASNSIIAFIFSLAIFFSIIGEYIGRFNEYIPFLAFEGFIISIFFVFEYYFVFRKEYTELGYFKLFKAITIFTIILVAGFFNYDLVYSLLFGQFVSLVYLVIRFYPFLRPIFNLRIDFFRAFLRENTNLMFFETLFNGVSQGMSHLPVVLLSVFFGDKVVAFYGMAQKVFATPIGVWSNSVSQLFYKKIVEFYNKGNGIHNYSVFILKMVLSISVIYGIIVVIIAPWLMTSFFGDEWLYSGRIAQIVVGLIVIQNAVLPFTSIFTVLRSQKRMLPYFSGGFFIRILIGFVLPYLLGFLFLEVLGFYTVISILYYIIFVSKIFSDSKEYDQKLQ